MTKEDFYKDLKECDPAALARAYHLYQEGSSSAALTTGNPMLQEIDRIYCGADIMSVQNAEKHRRILWAMAAAATFVTIAFLLYDEAELYGLIFACGAMVLGTFVIRKVADRLNCHRKYLEYRVLAESLRVQFFLLIAGVRTTVAELLPWSLQMSMPWVLELLQNLVSGERPDCREPVKDCWITDQRSYHERALKKAKAQDLVNNRITTVAFVITVIFYFVTLAFEVYMFSDKGHATVTFAEAQKIRAILKIILGSLSATTLFAGNYYGKMSLSNTINDHQRMGTLFRQSEEEIGEKGESEDLLIRLAREALNENSNWYAYQSNNTADISL